MAWIIDKDMAPYPGAEPGTPENATGLTGPSSFQPEEAELLYAFRLLGGDGEVCYEGRSTARDFSPLDEFGKRNAGCVLIQYEEEGVWRHLQRPPKKTKASRSGRKGR